MFTISVIELFELLLHKIKLNFPTIEKSKMKKERRNDYENKVVNINEFTINSESCNNGSRL